MSKCPNCDVGELVSHHDNNIIKYPNETIDIKIFYSLCSECNSEIYLPSQLKINSLIREIALMQHDGVLDSEEFRYILEYCIKVTKSKT